MAFCSSIGLIGNAPCTGYVCVGVGVRVCVGRHFDAFDNICVLGNCNGTRNGSLIFNPCPLAIFPLVANKIKPLPFPPGTQTFGRPTDITNICSGKVVLSYAIRNQKPTAKK